MKKILWLLLLNIVFSAACSQSRGNFTDSTVPVAAPDDLPVYNGETAESRANYVPAMLGAGRDVFLSFAVSHFSAFRFSPRGYDASNTSVSINGFGMNNPTTGIPLWSAWGGLNEVAYSSQPGLFTSASQKGFGGPAGSQYIDMRPSRLRAGTRSSYQFSNGLFSHRWAFTKVSALSPGGWTWAISVNFRQSSEGPVAGAFYNGGSYYAGADKMMKGGHLLSVVLFGNATVNGRPSSVLLESVDLANSHRYNPGWGMLNGRVRNANVTSIHAPVLICSDEYRPSPDTRITMAVGMQAGARAQTGLDWFHAADPRPDYYRYLPGYQQDSSARALVAAAYTSNPSLLQVNWARLYDVNRRSMETVNDADGSGAPVTGLHSHYILNDRVSAMFRYGASCNIVTAITPSLSLSGGIDIQVQHTRNYKRVNDLLGGDYFVDWNQFAEDDAQANPDVFQNDLAHPNHIVRKGGRYGYDYIVCNRKAGVWVQLQWERPKWSAFAAAGSGYSDLGRDGKMRNGLFPFDSYGPSSANSFIDGAIKGGIVYKASGRKYFYADLALFTMPPSFDDMFISPRTRDTRQETITQRKMVCSDAGIKLSSPQLSLRSALYWSAFTGGMDVLSFYHDAYNNFVNYSISGIGILHYGVECAAEYRSGRFIFSAALAAGKHAYLSRQQAAISVDNEAYVREKTTVYSKGFSAPVGPQQVGGFSARYQSPRGVYLTGSFSYAGGRFIDVNPVRRTSAAVDGLVAGSAQWNAIVLQSRLPGVCLLDLSAGSSLRVRLFHARHRQTLVFSNRVNNLLGKMFVVSAYEQLRFDTDGKDPAKFPPKYFFGQGTAFTSSVAIQL